MTLTEVLVIGGGLAVIVWLNWYFLFSDRRKRGSTQPPPPRPDAVRDTEAKRKQ